MTIHRQLPGWRPSDVLGPDVDHLRPRYHVMPEHGWLNDPNGVIKVDGTYHLFYQHNPAAAIWADIHWGHASSTDLVHWRHEPIALAPTPGGPDSDGCWSGSAVMGPDGPVLVYSGRSGDRETVCLAHGSADLKTWRKDPANPVLWPPADPAVTDFRDPRVWHDGDGWSMIIGVGLQAGPGSVLLYRSSDLRRWELVGPIIEGSEVDRGKVWECPDVFTVDGQGVLIFSVTPGEASTRFLIGRWDGRSFLATYGAPMDLGPYFYAAQTLADDSDRRIVWGWLREGRSVEAQRTAGWSGVLSVPRVLSIGGEGRLLAQPVPELEMLRGDGGFVGDLRVEPGYVHELSADTGHAWEARVRFSAEPGARLQLAFYAAHDGSEQTLVECDANAGSLLVDRMRSSLSPAAQRDRQTFQMWDAPHTEVDLRLFVDGSVVEMFIDGLSVTTRVYPTGRNSTGLRIGALDGIVHVSSVELWPLAAI